MEKAKQAQAKRDAEWEAAGFVPAHLAKRPVPTPQKPNQSTPPDDDIRADHTWLMFSLGGITALHGLNYVQAAKQGFTRGHWRQGVAELIAQQPGRVEDARAYVTGAARRAARQETPDVRLLPGYTPQVAWGGQALRFIGAVT